jgi:hypothetical protein
LDFVEEVDELLLCTFDELSPDRVVSGLQFFEEPCDVRLQMSFEHGLWLPLQTVDPAKSPSEYVSTGEKDGAFDCAARGDLYFHRHAVIVVIESLLHQHEQIWRAR